MTAMLTIPAERATLGELAGLTSDECGPGDEEVFAGADSGEGSPFSVLLIL